MCELTELISLASRQLAEKMADVAGISQGESSSVLTGTSLLSGCVTQYIHVI